MKRSYGEMYVVLPTRNIDKLKKLFSGDEGHSRQNDGNKRFSKCHLSYCQVGSVDAKDSGVYLTFDCEQSVSHSLFDTPFTLDDAVKQLDIKRLFNASHEEAFEFEESVVFDREDGYDSCEYERIDDPLPRPRAFFELETQSKLKGKSKDKQEEELE